MRRLAALLVTSIVLAGACSSSGGTQQPAGVDGTQQPTGASVNAPTTPAPQDGNGDVDCSYWCGTASVQMTMGGSTVTISPGGCLEGGADGVDLRVGDFTNVGTAAAKDYVIALVYHGGDGTPIASGTVNGKPFVLDASATGTIGDDGKGTFSGTNMVGNGTVTATFSCE